jgi:hypothetical protein
MSGMNSYEVLRRVLVKELGDEAGSVLEEHICVGIVRPNKKQLFEELGGYSFIDFPESSLCGHGLAAVFRPRPQNESYVITEESTVA